MYDVTVSRTFVAQHYLTVPNPGPEGELHSHTFTVDATFRGPQLNEYGYIVDIDEVNEAMDAVADEFRDETLNDLAAFEDRNPSVEHLGRIFGDRLLERLDPPGIEELEVAVREDDVATVSYTRELSA